MTSVLVIATWVTPEEVEFSIDHQSLKLSDENKVLEDHFCFKNFPRKPAVGSVMKITIDTKEFSDYDTLLAREDIFSLENSCLYFDSTLCVETNLAPVIDAALGFSPPEIYAKLDPVNSGLDAFKDRTGMRGL